MNQTKPKKFPFTFSRRFLFVLIAVQSAVLLHLLRISLPNLSIQPSLESTSKEEERTYGKNIFVYARCFGPREAHTHCNIYTAGFGRSDERVFHTVEYPDRGEGVYRGYGVAILGVARDQVIFSYVTMPPEDSENEATRHLVAKNLHTDEIHEILSYKIHSEDESEPYQIYVDTNNDIVFYSYNYLEGENPSPHYALNSYDLKTHQHQALPGIENGLFSIEGSSVNKIYLSDNLVGPGYIGMWSETYNIKFGAYESPLLEDTNARFVTFNADGTRVAYIVVDTLEDISDPKAPSHAKKRYQLFTGNSDGTEIELVKTTYTDGYPQMQDPHISETIHSISLSPRGGTVYFTVTREGDSIYEDLDFASYWHIVKDERVIVPVETLDLEVTTSINPPYFPGYSLFYGGEFYQPKRVETVFASNSGSGYPIEGLIFRGANGWFHADETSNEDGIEFTAARIIGANVFDVHLYVKE